MKSGQNRCSLKRVFAVTIYAALLAGTAATPAIAQPEIQPQAANSDPSGNSTANPSSRITTSDKTNTEILRELQKIRARIAKSRPNSRRSQGPSATAANDVQSSSRATATEQTVANPSPNVTSKEQTQAAPTNPEEPEAPFAYADWTWLNRTARNKDTVWDSSLHAGPSMVNITIIRG